MKLLLGIAIGAVGALLIVGYLTWDQIQAGFEWAWSMVSHP